MNRADIQPPIDFVQSRGTAAERARLRNMLDGEAVPDEVLEQFRQAQRGDGGWAPFWATDYSSLDATCFQLSQLRQLGVDSHGQMVVDAIRFLAERQNFDGSWEEDADRAADAPVWAMPGDLAAKLYVTANCGFMTAVTGLVPPAAHDAATFLSFHLSEDGGLPSFPQAHWLAAALWQYLDMADDAEKCLGNLAGRVPDLSAGNLAWMIVALRQGGVDAGHATVSAALERLGELRDPAGHWPSDEGADNAVHVTIEALRSYQLGGRLS